MEDAGAADSSGDGESGSGGEDEDVDARSGKQRSAQRRSQPPVFQNDDDDLGSLSPSMSTPIMILYATMMGLGLECEVDGHSHGMRMLVFPEQLWLIAQAWLQVHGSEGHG